MERSAELARPGFRLLSPLVGVLVVGLAAGSGATLLMSHRATALSVVCLLIAALPIVVRLAQRKFDPFEAVQIVAVTFIILYGVRPAAELIWGLKAFANQPTRDGFNGAALISAVGMLSLYIGYALGAGRRIASRTPSIAASWDTQRSVRYGSWLLVVCLFLTAGFAASVGPSVLFHYYWDGRGGSASGLTFTAVVGYVALGPYLTIPAAIIFGFAFARLRTFKIFALFLFCVLAVIFLTFPRGDRTFILAMVLPLVAFPYLRKLSRPRAATVVIALLASVFAMNIFQATRSVGRGRSGPLEAIATAVSQPGQQLQQFVTGVDLAEFSVLELEREGYSARVDPFTFHPGQTLLSAVSYWIPRRLLGGNKPPAAAQFVLNRLFPGQFLNGNRASFNPALFGDFFSDYGWVTIVLYDVMVGIVLRFMWEYFKRHERSEGVQILYAATLPILVIMVRNSVVDAFAQSLFQSGPLLLCLIVCSRQPKRALAGYRSRVAAPIGPGTELSL